ncbi:hypothetical protein DENSPDRAFT_507365 [Dentipellis sp. KUC8613]|nr:hypothetical protein DENSPDRAFT_507365 [Dentipellis sp. KUC8613]
MPDRVRSAIGFRLGRIQQRTTIAFVLSFQRRTVNSVTDHAYWSHAVSDFADPRRPMPPKSKVRTHPCAAVVGCYNLREKCGMQRAAYQARNMLRSVIQMPPAASAPQQLSCRQSQRMTCPSHHLIGFGKRLTKFLISTLRAHAAPMGMRWAITRWVRALRAVQSAHITRRITACRTFLHAWTPHVSDSPRPRPRNGVRSKAIASAPDATRGVTTIKRRDRRIRA